MRHPIEKFYALNLATNSTGDKATFPISSKCKVRMVWAQVIGTSSHATGFVLHFSRRILCGSDTGRTDATAGALSKTAGSSQAGKQLYEIPSTHVTLDPGDEIIVEVHTANGDACAINAGMEVEIMPEEPANCSDMVSA